MSRRLRRSSWDTCSLRSAPKGRASSTRAAPGGKTTLYASLAGPDGLVVANEIDRRRASVLADNVRKWGTGNVAVTTCEPRALGDFEAWFDVVAVDAPCSGEGMFRKDPDARGEWSEGNVKQCAARQDEILREAWRALRPGGTLVYSTCTFNRDEDEGALERMAAWAGDEIAESEETAVEDAWGIVCGRVGAFRTFRFYPHRTCGEGFFAAVARKSFDAGGACARRRRVARYLRPWTGRPPANWPAGCGIPAVCASQRWPTPAMHGTPRRPTPCGRSPRRCP